MTHDLAEAVRVADRIAVLDERVRGIAGERVVSLPEAQRDDDAVPSRRRRSAPIQAA